MARILVAAPDAAERKTLAAAFKVAGNVVVQAGDAASCLEILEKQPPEALILDPRLPGLESSQLLRHVRRNPALAAMKVSLLAHDMDAGLWEFLGRQFFDVVVEEAGAEAAGVLAAGPERHHLRGAKTKTAGAEQRRILVVEDEPTYCILLGTEFQAHGWETVGTDSAEAALEVLAKQEVNAVLSDINLPGMHGNELAARLRQEKPDLKVVLMTGMPRDRYPKVPDGIPILPKPISVRQLMAAMRFL